MKIDVAPEAAIGFSGVEVRHCSLVGVVASAEDTGVDVFDPDGFVRGDGDKELRVDGQMAAMMVLVQKKAMQRARDGSPPVSGPRIMFLRTILCFASCRKSGVADRFTWLYLHNVCINHMLNLARD